MIVVVLVVPSLCSLLVPGCGFFFFFLGACCLVIMVVVACMRAFYHCLLGDFCSG